MTFGCGGFGGNITSDNISPRHLLNIKRLAYEITPAVVSAASPQARLLASFRKLPRRRRAPRGLAAEPLARRIDEFLASRGYTAPAANGAGATRRRGRSPGATAGLSKSQPTSCARKTSVKL